VRCAADGFRPGQINERSQKFYRPNTAARSEILTLIRLQFPRSCDSDECAFSGDQVPTEWRPTVLAKGNGVAVLLKAIERAVSANRAILAKTRAHVDSEERAKYQRAMPIQGR